MRNQRSFRTKSRLKVVDNSVKVSQVIGKKDSNGQPFYPSFTNLTVVLVTEDKRTYETTKATADGLGNITFLKRGLADDGTDTEVASFKKAWMPGTLAFVTIASEDYDKKADISSVPTKTSDLTNDSGFIDNTVNDLVNYTKTSDLGTVATSNDYNDLDNKLTAGANISIDGNNEISATDTIPNNATIKIQKNGTDIESFTANENTNKTINITVPVTAADVSALPASTKYGATVDMSINSTTYVVTLTLKDQDGNTLGTAQTIDLPLESVVISGSYDDVNKKIVLTLQSGSTVEFSVADLVSGLQTEITNSNKLDADLVDDSTSTNKFVTASDLTKLSNTSGTNTGDQTASDFDIKDLSDSTGKRTSWDGKQDAISDLSTIRNGASAGATAVQPGDLTGYQTTANMVSDLTGADDDHYPTAKAVADALSCAGAGDMMASTYDPCNCNADAFDYCNFSNTPDLNCYQEKLTAGNNITINANTISGDFNYAEPTTAAACTTKCVCIPEITQLCAGQTIIVKPTITATNCATNIKLNSFDAYPVRFNNAALTSTTDGYVRGANQLAQFVFDGSYWHVVGKSYDANTTYTMNNSVDAGQYKAGSGTYAITRYSLVMEKDNGTWEKITATNATYSTGTSKSVNTSGFKLGHIRYYSGSSTFANGALVTTNVFNNKAASVAGSYSFNCGTAPGWSVGTYIYLVGSMGADGLFYLDTTQWRATSLPNTKDGKLYIRLGLTLKADDSTFSFLEDRPIYYYDNGIKVYGQADNKQDKISDLDTIRTGAACGATAAQPGDIPTDNCQLGNGCGYTTCTGTLTSSDISGLVAESCIACINGCCLTNGGDICVGGGGGGTVMCECCYDPGDYQQDFLYFTY